MFKKITSACKYYSYKSKLNLLLARMVKMPIILCFHRIKKPTPGFFDRRLEALDPEQFEWVISYIHSLGYRWVSLQRMYDNIIESRPCREAVVTFDDGFKDQFQNACPLLKKMDIPATLFLITSTVGSDKLLWLHKLYMLIEQINKDEAIALLTKYSPPPQPDMDFFHLMRHFVFSATKDQIHSLIETLAQKVNWTVDRERELSHQLYLTTDELRTMQNDGFTIEPHFHDHRPLHTLSEDQTRHDVEQSVSWIHNNLSYRPRFISYPFGFANQFCSGILNQLKLIGACTAEHRPVQIGENPYTMPRIYRNNSNCNRFSWQLSVFYLSAIRKRFLRF